MSLGDQTSSQQITYDKNIKESKINNKMIKISLLADDLTLTLQHIISIENALKLLNRLRFCLGLRMNIRKTKEHP